MAASMNESVASKTQDAEDDVDVDDWFYSTMTMYKKLHMFELQHPISTMCWIGQDRLCVAWHDATKSTKDSSEILELSLPSKLLAGNDEGLVKDRDFELLSGAFHDHCITSVQHTKQRCVVSCEAEENILCTWHLGDEASGIIKKTSVIQNVRPERAEAKVDVQPVHGNQAVFGNTVSNMCLADLNTGQVLSDTTGSRGKETVCGVGFTNENTVVICGQETGDLWIGDLRENFDKVTHHSAHTKDPLDIWAFDVHRGSANSDALIVRRSSQGHVYLSDLRNPTCCLKWGSVGQCQGCRMEVKCCATNRNVISTTGPKCDVNVYDTSEWTGPPVDGACVVPSVSTMFTHTGHKACSEQSGVRIATHIWHPTSEALVFSAASDGALHAWQYVSQAAKLSD